MHDPVWTETVDLPRHPRLQEDRACDVCVVGAGIAGVATAWELARRGLDVILLDQAHVGAGESHHTSGHLSAVLDQGLSEVEGVHGGDGLRSAVQGHGAAVDWIEARVREEGIDCGFRRLPAYLFLAGGDDPSRLEAELSAGRRAGLAVERVERVPGLSDGSSRAEGAGPALRFADQAAFHPLRFLKGLAEQLEASGGEVFGETRVVSLDDTREDGPRTVRTGGGPTVSARHVVLATNTPADHYLATLRMVPYRTFITVMELEEEVPDALWWDTADPFHYVRVVQAPAGPALMVGGGDYQAGTRDEGEERQHDLAAWARARFPVGEILYEWSGQVLQPADHLGLLGETVTESRVWMITGDGGQGLTNGVLGARIVADGITGLQSPWADTFSPSRLRLSAADQHLKDAVKVGSRYLEWLLPGEVDTEEAVPRGAGAVMRSGAAPVAVYRDEEGRVHRRSAVCPHAGCIVRWDSEQEAWHCPCHGSRFGARGELRGGPAVKDLDEA
jgi:glycine/D-amino acid oxidase-like deaminating enzyme/nitrite reductase/ring-hydroxylating ferredoxin subunit